MGSATTYGPHMTTHTPHDGTCDLLHLEAALYEQPTDTVVTTWDLLQMLRQARSTAGECRRKWLAAHDDGHVA
jgi:hypothetical protein